MRKAVIIREVRKTLKELSEEKLRVAMDFLGYLKEKEEMEATLEVLSSHELMSQIEEAEKAIKKGKLREFDPWEEVRRNV